MSTSPLLDLLLAQPDGALRETYDSLQRQIDQLQLHLDMVSSVLATKQREAQLLKNGKADVILESEGGIVQTVEVKRPRKKGEKRDRLIEFLSASVGMAMTYSELQRRLNAEGLKSTPESVRVMLKRMSDEGIVVKVGDGYRLASAVSAPNGAAPDHKEAQPQFQVARE